MFQSVEPLSKANHKDLKIKTINGYEFARGLLSAPLSASEVSMASRYYPIVFPDGEVIPVALFSMDQKTNCFLNGDGTWKVPYVPAHVRRYPFIFANTETNASGNGHKDYVLCIDKNAPHFNSETGNPLFTEVGQPTDLTVNALNFLKQYQVEIRHTLELCNELVIQGVLIEKRIGVKKNGKSVAIGGFKTVDVEKTYALEDPLLAKWVRTGVIALINHHLSSLSNFQALT